MFCTSCGRQINDDARFCPYCGKSAVESVTDVYSYTSSFDTAVSTPLLPKAYDVFSIIGVALMTLIGGLFYFGTFYYAYDVSYGLSTSLLVTVIAGNLAIVLAAALSSIKKPTFLSSAVIQLGFLISIQNFLGYFITFLLKELLGYGSLMGNTLAVALSSFICLAVCVVCTVVSSKRQTFKINQSSLIGSYLVFAAMVLSWIKVVFYEIFITTDVGRAITRSTGVYYWDILNVISIIISLFQILLLIAALLKVLISKNIIEKFTCGAIFLIYSVGNLIHTASSFTYNALTSDYGWRAYFNWMGLFTDVLLLAMAVVSVILIVTSLKKLKSNNQ